MTLGNHRYGIKLHRRGRVRCEPGWHLGRNWAKSLKDYDLWYVWDGKGRMKLNSGEIDLRAGTCLWMRPEHRYEAQQDVLARLGVSYVHFSLTEACHVLPLSGFKPPFEVTATRQVGFVDTLLRRIVEMEAEPDTELAAEELFGGLLTELIREHTTSLKLETPGTEQHHREVILHTAAQIRESPAQTPTVEELALAVGYSVDHFSRIFLKIMGLRPQAYVIQAKIERACQLLAESDLTVSAIAEALGFQEIFYFSRQFKQKTGRTPSEYRRGLRAM